MMDQSLPPTKPLKEVNVRYSQSVITHLYKHVRYNRHHSLRSKRVPSNSKPRVVIHARIQSTENDRHSPGNKHTDPEHNLYSISTILTARYRQDKTNKSNTIPVTVEKTTSQSATSSLSVNKDFQRSESLPSSIHNNWNKNDKMSDCNESVLERQQYLPSGSNRSLMNNNSSLIWNHSATIGKKELWGNTRDFKNKSTRKKKRRRRRCLGGCPCPCLIASLLMALLCIIIAVALLATLLKSQTTTTTTTAITTTASTIITFASGTTSTTSIGVPTPTQTTTATTVATTIVTTTFASTITTTPSCTTPSNSIFHYSSPSTQTPTYTYTALSTGTAILEFSFVSASNNRFGYLDDVSIVDTTSSNSEMLINGGFENGTLLGWEQPCNPSCGGYGASISTTSSSCNTGSFCFMDGCKGSIDFIRQTFTITIGHVYILSFWLNIPNTQNVYVRII